MENKLARLKTGIEEISDGNKILVIQFITIDKLGGEQLIRYTFINENLYYDYDKAQKSFTMEENSEGNLPKVSLVFDKIEDRPYFHSTLKSKKDNDNSNFKLFSPEWIKIQFIEKFISMQVDGYPDDIVGRWSWWCECLNKEFGYGKHAFWVNQEMAVSKDQSLFVSSIFLVFANSFPEGYNLYQIAKISRDFIISHIIKEYNNEVNKTATKAAISQVMARNMAHNIGSHVGFRASNIKIKERIKELYEKDFDVTRPEVVHWLDFMSDKLNKYQIARQEYLSDYDQSPIDMRFYQDIVLPFCENTLIMDNIAASENVNYIDSCNNKLKIICIINENEIKAEYSELSCFNRCDSICYPSKFPYLLVNKNIYASQNNEKDKFTKYSLDAGLNAKKLSNSDIEVTIPSEHAIYSIIENIIRNSSKHNKDVLQNSNLEITLKIKNVNNHYELIIYDNVTKLRKDIIYNEDDNSIGIYQKIKQSLITDKGDVRRENWGFADIRINSFLLYNNIEEMNNNDLSSNIELGAIDDEGNNFNKIDDNTILKNDGTKYRIAYKIKLSKPKKILWVGSLENEKLKDKQEITQIENIEAINSIKQDGLAAYKFVIFNNHFSYNEFIKFESKFPGRVIVLGENNYGPILKPNIIFANLEDSSKFNNISNVQDLLNLCWEIWFNRLNKKIKLFIYFEDAKFAGSWRTNGEESTKLLNNKIEFTPFHSLNNNIYLQNDDFNIVYDHHGNAFNNKLKTPQDDEGNETLSFYLYNSLIFFDKGSEDYAKLIFPPDGNNKMNLIFDIIDAATTNIFILDERIAAIANKDIVFASDFKDKGKSLEYNLKLKHINWKQYIAGNTFVFSHIVHNTTETCLIAKPNFDLKLLINNDEIKISINYNELDNNLQKDILIVHRTYLDKKYTGMDIEPFVDLLSKHFGSVILTSGGGYPHNIKKEVKFIPFSQLEKTINSRLSKVKLNNIIQSLKR